MSCLKEEKRSFCVGEIIKKLNTLDTWEKFVDFINTLTKAKLKATLKKAYQDAQVEDDLVISSAQEKKLADEAMESEIEGLF